MRVFLLALALAAVLAPALGYYGAEALAAVAPLPAPAVGGSKPILNPPAGHFAGKFELVPLFSRGKPVLKNGHAFYAERNTILFTTAAGDTVTFFGGETTDLASIPQVVWWALPPDGPWAEAALPHDGCYASHGDFVWTGPTGIKHVGRTRAAPYTRAECDEILREGMVALGVPGWKRVAIFEAVRTFGGSGFGH